MSEADMSRQFVHLRVKSAYSLLEGAIKAYDLGKMAHKLNMPAVAMADRCNLYGALEFSQSCKDSGVQPIVACSMPVKGIGGVPTERWGKIPTVALYAQNEQGYLNITKLSSIAYVEANAIDEPHVTWEQVATYSEGLILLSGGFDGPVDVLYRQNRGDEAKVALQAMKDVFKDRLYIELQRHDGSPQGGIKGSDTEAGLVEFAYAHDVPLVATNDVQFTSRDLYSAHEALLCISDGAYMGQTERRKVTPEHWFKPAVMMRELFSDLPEACDNTLEIARRCAFLVNKRDPILPRFDTGAGRNEDEELAYQAREGLKLRLSQVKLAFPQEDYWARLEREIGIIQKMGFPGYFLIVSDFIKWGKAQDIPVGPGRGSGAGSLVAWSLAITDLDPLRFGLLFERFLNPERVSMPDFDIDFCQERREEVISYVQEKYGRDRVAQIITFGTLQARAVLRDVGRVMQLPLGQVDRLSKMVPNNPANPTTLAQAIEIEPRLKEARNEDESVKRLLDTALKLEGLYRNASTHAAGIVIGDRPLTELVPLYRDPRSDIPATQFNMKWVESAGLVKFDFLGLKTLTTLKRAQNYLKKRGVEINYSTLPLDDSPTYELLASGQAIGVFQLESQGMRDTLRKLRCGSLEEITALISLYRPGPMDNIDTYVDRKFGRADIDMLHPSLEPVLKETYGVIIYQEQVMQIAQVLSGYSLGEADLLRRAMGKKKKEEMDLQKVRFISGAAEKGVPEKQSDFIFELVNKFAGYGFNKSHAAAYAFISYQTGYLKANYPVEFFAATLSLDITNTDKLAVFYQDARRFNVVIRPPDINRSMADFDVEDGEVLYALGAIRNVGFEAMLSVVQAREEGGKFTDLFDFLERIDPKAVNKRALENLARAGAFDGIHSNRAQIVAGADILIAYAQSIAADRAASQVSLFGSNESSRPRLPTVPMVSGPARLDEELAAIGFYLSGHPLQDMLDVFKRRNVTLYADAVSLASEGREAFRMAGIIRRKQERAAQGSGEKFAFVTLSDPSGEYEVLFPPESLRKNRDHLEVGASIVLKVRSKGRDGEVRFFGDDAGPMSATLKTDDLGLKVHVSAQVINLAELRAQLEVARSDKGGEISLVSDLGSEGQIEFKLPQRYNLDAHVRGALKQMTGVLYYEDV
ncbi:DNA polymerase III subunit alpha [Asticcacaulis benevestitus]|uniref:DNA polymerase III subunit alpha n=1 Tax=Asticcacaulis benevestitus DSM 16100 = ATCC BAA-896 TaxID=1121022 RepID=V4PH31_9CAUL|nr:DNA polymerase III subunit alpha [Asticcacaulis benevestitus]ESQ93232.1 DNA polymerase III subunit alpha [Asticcacaulis benevestitus DSM 16100 = ATCC BAA-896]